MPQYKPRSSTSSTSPVCLLNSTTANDKELTDRLSLGIVQNVVLNVGARAQLRRRNSSLSRRKSSLRTELTNTTTSPYIEEWSETFVAQDGVLTTNFCSTELWHLHPRNKKGRFCHSIFFHRTCGNGPLKRDNSSFATQELNCLHSLDVSAEYREIRSTQTNEINGWNSDGGTI